MQGSIYGDVSPKAFDMLRAKVGVFQLLYPVKMKGFKKTIHNIFNVDIVTDDLDDVRVLQPVIGVKWRTGRDAYIEFVPDKESDMGIAHMPDDPFWHNRLVLMDSYNNMYHSSMLDWVQFFKIPTSSDGTADTMSPAEVKLEIDCMASILKTKHDIWKVMANGVEVAFFFSEKEAKEFIDENGKLTLTSGEGGVLKHEMKHKVKFTIEKGEKIDYKKEIVELAKTESRKHQFGWTQSDAFTKGIAPQILDLIKKQRAKNEPTGFFNFSKEDLDMLKILKEIGPDGMSKLRALAGTKAPAKAKAAAGPGKPEANVVR